MTTDTARTRILPLDPSDGYDGAAMVHVIGDAQKKVKPIRLVDGGTLDETKHMQQTQIGLR